MMDMGVRGWDELGVVGTIYEEEDEDSLSSPSFGSSSSLSPTPLIYTTKEHPWSRRNPDVVIYVQGTCFRLHKDLLIAKSAYLKRYLHEFPEMTLSPPLNITPQTFSLVTDFCYGAHLAVTPFNVASLLTAAELLQMTDGQQSLKHLTEAYFLRVVSVNRECASVVLRSCFPLLPEAETAAFLVSRCLEALSLTEEEDGDFGYLDDFNSVIIEDLNVILESVSRRLDRHDLLYRIIDTYLKEKAGKVSEDEKIKMCNYMDCSILSPTLVMHAVQNPRMPLRFVVQAMFLQQLNTRHSLISATSHRHHSPSPTTLGAMLQRDAALRQVSHMEATMKATASRIQNLEEQITGMKKMLNESDSRINSERSASFRFSSESRKVERGQMGSVSSLSYRDVSRKVGTSSLEGSPGVGRRLINGLKSAFRLQKKKSRGPTKNEETEEGKVVIIKKDQLFHSRPLSQF